MVASTLRYALPKAQRVRVGLYDVLGRKVRTVVDGQREGRHKTQIDVRGLAGGVYFLRVRTEGTTTTQKMTVVR